MVIYSIKYWVQHQWKYAHSKLMWIVFLSIINSNLSVLPYRHMPHILLCCMYNYDSCISFWMIITVFDYVFVVVFNFPILLHWYNSLLSIHRISNDHINCIDSYFYISIISVICLDCWPFVYLIFECSAISACSAILRLKKLFLNSRIEPQQGKWNPMSY